MASNQQPANLIVPRIWLGNRYAAHDLDFIRDNNITVIVNASKDIPFVSLPHIKKYRVPVDDNLEPVEINNMARWLPEIVYTVLQEYMAGNTILIHCAAGMQRSAAIVAAVLIVLRQMNPDEAMQYVRSQRRIAFFPSANFERSIRDFHRYYIDTIIPSLRQAAPAATGQAAPAVTGQAAPAAHHTL